MNKLYQIYLTTKEWKKKSDDCKKLADYKCVKCSSVKNLHAHHLTYDRIGEELQSDLQCLCLTCHEKEHGRTFKKKGINYLRIGNGTMNKENGIKSIDLIKLMVDMTKPEVKAISFLIENVPWEQDPITNKFFTLGIVWIPVSVFNTKAERLMFQRGVKNLIEKDLVRKTNKNSYMLNPLAVLPTNESEAYRKWTELKENK